MASKLNNIKAIREMVAGEHRFQTRKSHNFDVSETLKEKNKTREIGDVWEEVNPVTGIVTIWEQRKGYRAKRVKGGNAITAHIDTREEFPNCYHDSCKTKPKNHLDSKMKGIHGMCFDCVVEMEGRLKYQGKFDEYARNKMKANAQAFLRDAKKEVEIVAETFKDINYSNSDGSLDKFVMENPEQYAQHIRDEFSKFEEDLLSQFEEKKEEG